MFLAYNLNRAGGDLCLRLTIPALGLRLGFYEQGEGNAGRVCRYIVGVMAIWLDRWPNIWRSAARCAAGGSGYFSDTPFHRAQSHVIRARRKSLTLIFHAC